MSSILGCSRWVVACDLVLVRVETGRKRHQSRTTEGSGDVSTLKKRTLGSELIEMRRLDVRVPHEAVVGITVIVGQDQHHVGWLGFRRVKHDSAEQDGDQGFDKRFHGVRKKGF